MTIFWLHHTAHIAIFRARFHEEHFYYELPRNISCSVVQLVAYYTTQGGFIFTVAYSGHAIHIHS